MQAILICFLLMMYGCGGMNGVHQPPPDPFEAKVLSQTIMAVGIHSQKLSPDKVNQVMTIFKDGRGALQLAMAENPSSVEPITMDFVKNMDPVYQEVMKGMLQVFIIRLRPFTQQGGDSALAATYIDAVFDGAILACESALGKRPTGPTPFPPQPGLGA